MNPHILFVDDETPTRDLVSLFFRKRGLKVTTAMSGKEARELAGKDRFDLVILDLDLAGENGLDLLGFFKAKYRHLPIIIFTGLGSDETLVAQTRAAGAVGFISKTDPLHQLLAEVLRHAPLKLVPTAPPLHATDSHRVRVVLNKPLTPEDAD